MKRCVIIGGAPIKDATRIRRFFREDDFFVCCDSGLLHKTALRVRPALLIGDFDSLPSPEQELPKDCDVITLPVEKDDTDTLYAVREALRRGYTDFLLCGCTGKRLDHTLANVAALSLLHQKGCHALLVDDYAEMEIAGEKPVFVEDRYPYFSLLALGGKATGVTVEDAKYPLQDATLFPHIPLGVSNEVLPGKTAKISVREGELLLIRIAA